jgi:mono/diheme cytochrome c family protein
MMTTRARLSLVIAGFAVAGLLSTASVLHARETSHSDIARGRYLVAAGDCAACHTADGGQPFAGGRAIPTPFGTIYSTNITPDADTGIGHWTSDDFYRAMHEGLAPGGRHLYPAFPYPWYTKLTRDDVDDIRGYLATLAPVRQVNQPTKLPWPFDVRGVMAGWNALYFNQGTFRSNPQKSAEWNLGGYLVEGLGHCGACHTPKNFAGAPKRGEHLQGGYGENWYAASLAGDLRDGLGAWSVQDVVDYLKKGVNDKAAAFGPMAEVVHNSTQHLDDKDVRAMAVYLKDLPAQETSKSASSARPDDARMARGRGLYLDQCAGCHMQNGEGVANAFPPLEGNAVVQAKDPETLVHIILTGEKTAVTRANRTGMAMPAFDWKLSDDDIADLASYLRNAWGNAAEPVDSRKIADLRRDIRKFAANAK